MSSTVSSHLTVLLDETVEALAVREGGSYIDGTLGGGGHAAAILARAGEHGRLLGIDRDAHALVRAGERLASVPGTKVLAHGAHGELEELAQANGFAAVDGILLDTGVSSDQLDTPERGFSFRLDGPLDMRMDGERGESAAELLVRLSESELTELLWRLGEEPRARRIARAIVAEQSKEPITGTLRLARIVEAAVGGRGGARHPATRVFQALRMEVNQELEELKRALEAGIRLLVEGGRLAVITFESLSDRVVKQCFTAHVGRWVALQEGGECREGLEPAVEWIVKRPVQAGAVEVANNARARTAKLRVVRRGELRYT